MPVNTSLQSCWSTFVSNTSPVSFLMQTTRLMLCCPPPSNQVGRWGNTNKLGTCACVLKSVLYYTTSQNISNVYIYISVKLISDLVPWPLFFRITSWQLIFNQKQPYLPSPSCMLCFTTPRPARAHKRPRSKFVEWLKLRHVGHLHDVSALFLFLFSVGEQIVLYHVLLIFQGTSTIWTLEPFTFGQFSERMDRLKTW